MAGQHDGATVGTELTDELADLHHTGRIEAVGRLIEKDELRIAEKGEGDTEPLFHTERVRGELAVGALAETTSFSNRSMSAGDPRRPMAWKYRRFARPDRYG